MDEIKQASESRPIDQTKIPYQKPQPVGMVPDVFIGSALELDADEREWVPQSPTVAFRPLVLNVTQSYYINILWVRSNVLATPHIGYVTEDLYRTFYGDAAPNIAKWIEATAVGTNNQ